jgi:hypothetical protein
MSASSTIPAGTRAPQSYGTIVVVGGGCYGSYYVRQLGRAAAAGALLSDRVVVVDRDPECQVARAVADGATSGVSVRTADWVEFFAEYLAAAAADPAGAARDAVVPSPLMPHLMYDWLLARARARWPGRPVRTLPLPEPPPTPWERAAPDGTHYVSYATWMCPINCIEPARCPHTRGPRSWSMTTGVPGYVVAANDAGRATLGPLLFHVTHRAYGVGMLDTRDVVAADRFVADAAAAADARILVGTVSHCHGALNLLAIGG